MRKLPQTVAVLALLFPLAAMGQSLSERLSDAPNIPFEEWREITAGLTVVYEIEGDIYGYEAYRRNSNRVTIQLQDGSCVDGEWYMEQAAFCFNWEDTLLNCFNHKRLGGSIYVIGLEAGVETEEIQKVVEIESIPLQCGPALLSRYTPEVNP